MNEEKEGGRDVVRLHRPEPTMKLVANTLSKRAAMQ